MPYHAHRLDKWPTEMNFTNHTSSPICCCQVQRELWWWTVLLIAGFHSNAPLNNLWAHAEQQSQSHWDAGFYANTISHNQPCTGLLMTGTGGGRIFEWGFSTVQCWMTSFQIRWENSKAREYHARHELKPYNSSLNTERMRMCCWTLTVFVCLCIAWGFLQSWRFGEERRSNIRQRQALSH